jgi:hypothetical protein
MKKASFHKKKTIPAPAYPHNIYYGNFAKFTHNPVMSLSGP